MSDGISKLVRFVVKVGVPAVPAAISPFTLPAQYSSCRTPGTKVVAALVTLNDNTAIVAKNMIRFIGSSVLTGNQNGHFWSFELWNYSGTVGISTAVEINVNPFLPDVSVGSQFEPSS